MKDFIIQCLKDLESLTGIRQLYFLEQREDGAKQIETVINGILFACKRHSYIPEEAQMRIISQMMMEDQDFDSLNGRVVNKWLESNKGHWYFSTPKITEEELTPAPPEVADKYAKELLASIEKIGNPEYKNGMKEIREKNGYGKAVSVGVIKNYEIGQTCAQCGGTGKAGPSPEEEFECTHCNGKGQTDTIFIPATSIEEARKQYTELFGGEITKKL